MDKKTAKSSRLNVLYRVSDGLSFLEKNEMGFHCPLTYCWRTAPTAESDASVIRLVRALGVGCTNSVAAARASLMAEKAWVAVSSHERRSVDDVKRELSGCRILAQPGMVKID